MRKNVKKALIIAAIITAVATGAVWVKRKIEPEIVYHIYKNGYLI